MGQRSENHLLALAKEKKEDEMGWQKGQPLGWPVSRQVALLAQDLLPLGTGGRGARSPPAPHPHPLTLHLPGVLKVSARFPQGLSPLLGSLWWGEFCAQKSVVGGPSGSTGVRPQGSEEESTGGKFQG